MYSAVYYASPEGSWQRTVANQFHAPRNNQNTAAAALAQQEHKRNEALQDAYRGRESLDDLIAARHLYEQRWKKSS
jgi:hypothetical protein